MSPSESSPDAFSRSIMALSPEERYKRLKMLDGNDLFCQVIRLLPTEARNEFAWFEKRAELESHLKHIVSLAEMEGLVQSGTEDLGPTSLRSLVECLSDGDAIWLFEAFPGDKGYALVRDGRVIDYSIIEVSNV